MKFFYHYVCFGLEKSVISGSFVYKKNGVHSLNLIFKKIWNKQLFTVHSREMNTSYFIFYEHILLSKVQDENAVRGYP